MNPTFSASATYESDRPCDAGHVLRYRRNDRCAECERARKRRTQEADRAAHAARVRTWRARHPEESRASAARRSQRDPGAKKARIRRWQLENPLRVLELAAERRSRVRRAPGIRVTDAEWQSVLADASGHCAYCGGARPLEKDHVDPLVHGGEHDATNLLAACADCNRSKGERFLVLWLAIRRARRAA